MPCRFRLIVAAALVTAYTRVDARDARAAQIDFTVPVRLAANEIVASAPDVEHRRFLGLVDVFRKYGDRYNLDYRLLMAQGYQESRLDQRARSRAGAVGIMQVLPTTARDLGIEGIHRVDANVHAGAKYIRQLIDEHFDEANVAAVDKMLFAFAAYNTGPTRVRQLRRESAARGLDPDVWFDNVERIAGERIGRETVQYVSNIFKYYVAYTLAAPTGALE